MSNPFHQHLFDATPLLEHEFVVDLVIDFRERNLVGQKGNRRASPDQEGLS
jgi:hypothetical protein